MLDFHQWLENNNLSVGGASRKEKKLCPDCRYKDTTHKSGLCFNCRRLALGAINNIDNEPHPASNRPESAREDTKTTKYGLPDETEN
jgi:hypothetical protein